MTLDEERFEPAKQQLSRLLDILEKLRQPGGCPWDRKQTSRSLAPYLLEETHEVIEAIEAEDPEWLCEELGDLLLQIVFHAQIQSEADQFDMSLVIRGIADKLVRRHPHVFAGLDYQDEQELHDNWERIKAEEKRRHKRHRSSTKPSPNIPSLQVIQRLHARGDSRLYEAPKMCPTTPVELNAALEYLKKIPAPDFNDTVATFLTSVAEVATSKHLDIEGALRTRVSRIISDESCEE